MKITLNIDDVLWVEAKAMAERQGVTLTRLVEEGLRMRLLSEKVTHDKAGQAMPASPQAARPSIRELFGVAPDYDPIDPAR